MLKWWTRLESLDGFSCHGVCCSGKGAVLLCWALIAIDVTGLTKMMLLKIRSFWSDTVFKLVMLTGWCRVNNWACLSEAWWEFHVALIGCFWATKMSFQVAYRGRSGNSSFLRSNTRPMERNGRIKKSWVLLQAAFVLRSENAFLNEERLS